MVLKVKQFGIQRSGTNYIRQLLLDNVQKVIVYEHQFGRKHAAPFSKKRLEEWAAKHNRPVITKEDNVHPIIIIKNPYSWYQSIKNYKNNKFSLHDSYNKYNRLYKAYKDLYVKGHKIFGEAYIVQYEVLLVDPKTEVAKIVNKFGGKLKKTFKDPDKVIMSDKFTPARREFYLGASDFGLDKEIIKMINEIIDWDTIEFYGYKRRN